MNEPYDTETYYGSEKVHQAVYSGMFGSFTKQEWLRLALAALDQSAGPRDNKIMYHIISLEKLLENQENEI